MPPPPFEVSLAGNELSASAAPPVPRYLEQVYWWAYVHPKAVRLFERRITHVQGATLRDHVT